MLKNFKYLDLGKYQHLVRHLTGEILNTQSALPAHDTFLNQFKKLQVILLIKIFA